MRSTTIAFAAALGAALFVEGAAKASDAESCVTAAEEAQRLRDDGRYRPAREKLLMCARSTCPGAIRNDCSRWLVDVDRDAPTVVFGAKDSAGHDLVDVSVSADGEPLVPRLDGKPVLVDAGQHTFTFVFPSGEVKEERVVMRAAEKARPILVTSASDSGAKTSEPADSTRPSLLLPIAVAGVGVLALGSFAFFGITGSSDYDEFDACRPSCSEARVDAVRTKLLIADVSLGAAIVAFGAATYLYLTRPASPPPRSGRGLHLGGGALAGGGYATIGSAF